MKSTLPISYNNQWMHLEVSKLIKGPNENTKPWNPKQRRGNSN